MQEMALYKIASAAFRVRWGWAWIPRLVLGDLDVKSGSMEYLYVLQYTIVVRIYYK